MNNKDKFRCHFSVIIEELFIVIAFIIVNIVDIFLKSDASTNLLFKYSNKAIFVLIFIGIYILYKINRWRKTWIYVKDNTLVVERNTINKKVSTIAIGHISNINLEQNIFERIVGTYKFKLDINSSVNANETDVKIVLKKQKALELKEQLLSIIFSDNKEKAIKKEDKYDIYYSIGEVISHAFLSLSMKTIIYFLAVCIVGIINYDDIIKDITDKGKIRIIIGGIALLGVVIYKILKDVLKFYDFKVGRRKDKIYISYGLLNRREYIIPIDKINGIISDEQIIARMFNNKNIQIVNVGMGDEKSEEAQLLLYEDESSIREKLMRLLPEFYLPEKDEIMKQSKKCFLIKAIYFAIFSLITVIFSINTSLVFLTLILLYIFISLLKYSTWGLYVDDKVLGIFSGTFRKRGKYFEYKKIQNVNIKSNIVSNKFKIEKMSIIVLGTIINSINLIGYYDNEIIEDINKRIS